MAETGNIEELAKIVSSDIFEWFKWGVCSLKDTNWQCVSNHHKKKTHPADVVFYYDDPYTGDTLYINTDLKSYKKDSIQSSAVSKAIKSLSMAVECANISDDWQKKYIINDVNYGRVMGMLFIYNHDNEFDKSLSGLIDSIEFEKLSIPSNVLLVLFDPQKIKKLVNIVNDMKGLVADGKLQKNAYTFFYPDLVMSKRHGEEWGQPATVQALTSPWLIIKHKDAEKIGEGYLIYYNKPGDTVEEFIYLIDAMSHYQMLLSDKPIRVHFTEPCSDAAVNFNRAKNEYLSMWGPDEAREVQLGKIKPKSITNVVTGFNPMEIGMRDNEQ